jgi:hypothetical protein
LISVLGLAGTTLELRRLGSILDEYSQVSFYDTDQSTRAQIKVLLIDLLVATLQNGNIIVCTVAVAAKVNFINNFSPSVIYIDEAVRLTELRTLIPLGIYSPTAFLFAADHKQMRPTLLSLQLKYYGLGKWL